MLPRHRLHLQIERHYRQSNIIPAIVLNSQGNNLANTLTPIYTKETKQEIQAGFAIVGAFSNEVGTFLSNRAAETTKAEQTIKGAKQAIENELKKPESQQDMAVIEEASQTIYQANQIMKSNGSVSIDFN